MNILSLAILLSSILVSTSVRADWVVLGVAMQCDSQRKVFAVVPTAETSSKKYNIAAPNKFTELYEGTTQYYKCNLSGIKIEITINVYGPQARGMGQGGGVIIIDNLVINREFMIDKPTNFNWQVMSEKVLTEIRVEEKERGYKLEQCYSNGWDWDAPYQELQCKTTTIESNG